MDMLNVMMILIGQALYDRQSRHLRKTKWDGVNFTTVGEGK